MRNGLLVVLVSLGVSSVTSAQTPAGGPFRVNTFTVNEQKLGHPAIGPRGDFLISWSSLEQDGSGFGVYAQRYDALGNPQGGEFRVNTQAAGNQYSTTAVADAGGNYIIAWTNDSGNPDPSRDVFARIFSPAGVPLTADFRVNTFFAGRQSAPSIAPQPGGEFVVVWESLNQDGSSFAVIGRRFDSRGRPLTTEFLINTFTAGEQAAPRVDSDAAGNFTVVWNSMGQDGSGRAVIGRRFFPNGAAQGGEFQVSVTSVNYQQYPAISTLKDGRFTVVWEDQLRDGGRYGIFGRKFDAAGTPTTGEFQINVYTTDHQHTPTVAAYGNGSFMAAWYSQDQLSFNNQDVFARQYDPANTPGPEFLMNSYTTSQQFLAALDADEVGNVVAVWDSIGQDGSLNGVYARRFGGLVPYGMTVDGLAVPSSNGNRVLEAGETVVVQPAWRNVNGATLSFDGVVSSFTGPAGGTYTALDDMAGYGVVANNAIGNCGGAIGCYAVRVTAATRPVAHWDAELREDISPLGLSKAWSLHVGDTFSDVPRSSSFYRFVETVLHNGVMPGCTASQFCPFGAVFRDQMAMFVMKSREPFYLPPACTAGTEMFADVPAANPYCRWVEELARRGVVAGCGGGNYCPGTGVTREQLAVYLLATLEGTGYTPPACGVPAFSDVPASSGFCRWIEELRRRGVVTGCGGSNYCPASVVGRDQMTVFLTVTFGLTLYGT